MQELITQLEKRRKVATYIVVLLIFVALAISLNFQISPSSYFYPQYNMYFANGLILYKIIELFIFYYFLFYRYMKKLKEYNENEDFFPKMQKHTKLLFFLIPQGNTVFGIIAYKLSGNVSYFLIFSIIALITLYIIKPNKLGTYNINSQT